MNVAKWRPFPQLNDDYHALMPVYESGINRTDYDSLGRSDLSMLPKIATVVEVRTPNQEWLVKCHGSFWRARSRRNHLVLAIGDDVKVVNCQGNVLIIEEHLPQIRELPFARS